MTVMMPVFEFDSFISERSYRSVLKRSAYNLRWIISTFLGADCTAFGLYYVIKSIGYISSGINLNVFNIIIFAICAVAGVLIVISNFKMPGRFADNAINELVMQTGSPDINQHLLFYEDKIVMKNSLNGNERFFTYDMVQKIFDYNEFLILRGPSKSVYVSKKNIPDSKAFNDFLWSKCINAQYKKVGR